MNYLDKLVTERNLPGLEEEERKIQEININLYSVLNQNPSEYQENTTKNAIRDNLEILNYIEICKSRVIAMIYS